MGVRGLAKQMKGFYRRLAWTNVKRSRDVSLPYCLATAIISSVFFLSVGLAFSDSLSNVPNGPIAMSVFSVGIFTFAVFAFFFMLYLNNFLIKRRKKEFGLYAVLGLSRRHVGRVLLWENVFLLGGGLLGGLLLSLVCGRLLFELLLRLIHAVPGSYFSPSPLAYFATLALFGLVFVVTSLYNLAQIRLANPIALLQSEKKGEKQSRLMIPLALFGALALGVAYYFAWTIDNEGLAIGIFFPLVLLVILATYALFSSGSIVVLRALRANKRHYYQPKHFIAISGMFHRMKQNAAGLATICILSTMLLVTVSGTLSLYLGQEKILAERYPYDVEIALDMEEAADAAVYDQALAALAAEHGVTLRTDDIPVMPAGPDGARPETDEPALYYGTLQTLAHSLFVNNAELYFNVDGAEADCLAFIAALRDGEAVPNYYIADVFSTRQEDYALFGGLLFLGAFFGVVFLVVAVLIIYFKQITEGYEDKERFAILQKVGMDEAQVKATINQQVRWVFFIPLAVTLLHMLFARRILANMLQAFTMYDWGLVLWCVAGACVLFVLLYLIIYRLTARVYFRIVRW